MIAGGLDQLSDEEDLRTLTTSLLSNVSIYTHVEPDYQHLDFTCKFPFKSRLLPSQLVCVFS